MAIAELDWRSPTGADWRVELIKLTDAIWELYQRHPGLAEAFRTMEIMPQSGIRAFAEAVSRLQAHGFLLEDAVLAIDTLVDLVGDCFLGWHALGQADRQQGTRMDAMVAQWRREACALPDHAEQIGGMITVMQGGARPGGNVSEIWYSTGCSSAIRQPRDSALFHVRVIVLPWGATRRVGSWLISTSAKGYVARRSMTNSRLCCHAGSLAHRAPHPEARYLAER